MYLLERRAVPEIGKIEYMTVILTEDFKISLQKYKLYRS